MRRFFLMPFIILFLLSGCGEEKKPTSKKTENELSFVGCFIKKKESSEKNNSILKIELNTDGSYALKEIVNGKVQEREHDKDKYEEMMRHFVLMRIDEDLIKGLKLSMEQSAEIAKFKIGLGLKAGNELFPLILEAREEFENELGAKYFMMPVYKMEKVKCEF
jgi:hypothetical protein